MSVTVHHADNRDVLATLADNSIDAVVTDPPYAFGFMGKQWDTGEVAFAEEFWAQVWRVLKPGGHLVAFSGTRTYHRMVVAIEDAGFEIRDQLAWVYGSGFPKSHDVAKGIDRALGVEGGKVPSGAPVRRIRPGADQHKAGSWEKLEGREYQPGSYVPGSEAAEAWSGYGTALKPSWEPICLARKPLDGTVAENVLRWGVGALNIDGCRVAHSEECRSMAPSQANIANPSEKHRQAGRRQETLELKPSGRWPANVLHDGSDEVVEAFGPDTSSGTGAIKRDSAAGYRGNALGAESRPAGTAMISHGDSGSPARFFYAAEPDDLCGLCGCPSGVFSGKLSPCNANTAEPSSPTENTQSAATAPCDAVGSQLPVREVKNQASSGLATDAELPSSRHHQAGSDTAAEPAATPGLSSLAQNVKSAGNLCGSCATAIAQSLAATQRGQSPASLPCPASIDGRSWQILTSSLALHVEGRESTDTTTTIPSLKLLLGSVFHAIGDTTRPAKGVAQANTESGPKRFHYSSKADATDRLGSKHPTVKPVDLMAWLVRMVCPPGGVVLDPFAGSGTTGLAAMREGRDCVLIEREDEYVADINRRIAWANGEGKLTAQELGKKQETVEALPLFGGAA